MPIKPTAMVIRDGTSIRTRPDLSAESSPWVLTGRAATVTVIAQVPDGFDFGAGPLWFAYVINTGGLRYFHSQDVVRQAVLVDPAPLNAQIATLSGQVTTLTGTVETQSDKIASLMTEVAEAEQAAAEALTRAEAAEEAAGSAVALRAALQTFLS